MTTAIPASTAIAPPSDLLALHLCRSQEELESELRARLSARLHDDFVLALHTGADRHLAVRLGRSAHWRGDERLPPAVANGGWQELPVHYRSHRLGSLFVEAAPQPAVERWLGDVLDHFGVALANLTMNAEARAASAHYCASLQAFEEGIVLLQESNRETVVARLLSLAAAMAAAPAGALFVLGEAGNAQSPLEIAQLHSMPAALLEAIRGLGAEPWPRALMRRNTFHVRRAADPTLGGLDPDTVPRFVTSLLAVPLRYLGIDTGVCVLFNVDGDDEALRGLCERVDSFGRLGAAVLHRLHLEAVNSRQHSIERELQIAATIQAHLLPREAPEVERMEFAWHSLSANNIGGDYLDFVVSDLGDLCAIIADASGHGITSALLMSSFRSAYRAEAPWRETDALCRFLNGEVVDEVGPTGMFITTAALRIDHQTLRMTITSAGHNPVLLCRADGESVAIDSHGPPLGFARDSDFGSQSVQLRPGDVLLLYTDGVTEACNQDLEMFGVERLGALLHTHRDRPPAQLLAAVLAGLAEFAGRSRYDDDVSLAIVKIAR